MVKFKKRRRRSRFRKWLDRENRRSKKLMKKKSGDVMYNCIHFPLIFMGKIGITNTLDRRMKEIDESIPGWLIPIPFCCPRLRNARSHERRMHNLFRFFRRTFTGSGKTEYFFSPVVLISAIYSLFVYDLQRNLGAFTLIILIWLYMGRPIPNL